MTDTMITPNLDMRAARVRPAPVGARPLASNGVTTESLGALGRALERGIERRLRSTSARLRTWVRDAVDRAARETEGFDPSALRRRQVMDKLRLGSGATANMLLLLVDEPGICHDHAALAGQGVSIESAGTSVPAKIWQLRNRLMIHGLGDAIRNRSGHGYFVNRADAGLIKELWGETGGS